jgi:hypothetical protein
MHQRAYTEKATLSSQEIDSRPPGKSSGQTLILPNDVARKFVHRNEKVTTILCNSRERNIIAYPNPNSFRWRLRRDMKDITSIRLIGGSLPANFYNINLGWNIFSFLEGSVTITVVLRPGSYDGTSLSVELARALNASCTNTYTVLYSSTTQKLTISRATGSKTYSFLFQSGSYIDSFDDFYGAVDTLSNDYLSGIKCPARILGFVSNDYTCDASGNLVAPFAVDNAWFLNKIFLHINTDTNKDLNRIEVAQGRSDPYAIVYLDEVLNGIKFLNKETDYPILEFSPAPLSRLSLLEISLRDEFYRLLDTQNKEFTLVFELTHLV